MDKNNTVNDLEPDIIYITSCVYLVLVGVAGISLNNIAIIKVLQVSSNTVKINIKPNVLFFPQLYI